MEARRAKGLCYWCPERDTVGHNCKGKQVFVIEVGEDGVTEPNKIHVATGVAAETEEAIEQIEKAP